MNVFHYDPASAAQFNAARRAEVEQLNATVAKTPASNENEASGSDRIRVGLKYYPPDQLTADARKAAQAKAFSPEEEEAALAQIPAGGTCAVYLYGSIAGYADPKLLSYVVFNSAGEVIGRRKGDSTVLPTKNGYWWRGYDHIDLPGFEYSLRVRIYHEVLAQTLGEYIFRRNQKPKRVCCDQFLPPDE